MAKFAAVIGHVRKLLGRDSPSPDGELLARFAQHRDQDAFAAIVNRHGPMVFRVCQRVLRDCQDAEDAFQATFLILARKAGSLTGEAALPRWLHTVAFNTALNARHSSQRRQQRERQAAAMTDAVARDEAWDEIRDVLDRELDSLPARYRTPLVLCYLMSKTHEEAGQELGYSAKTVQRRLEEGRELLRRRLTRQGLVLTSSLLSAALAEHACQGAVPASLMSSTTDAVSQGPRSASVAMLIQQGVRQMLVSRVKLVAALAAGLLVLGAGAGLVTHRVLAAAGQPEAVEPGKDKAASKPQADAKPRTIPAGVPLELKLVAKNATYTLDRKGRTEPNYHAWVSGRLNERMPPPLPVELVLELRNTGDKPLTVWVEGDGTARGFDLQGKGAVNFKSGGKAERRGSPAVGRKLASGQTFTMPVTTLASDAWNESGDRSTSWRGYWTEPGEHTLTASFKTAVSPAPQGAMPARDKGYGLVTLLSNPVKIKVKPEKKESKTRTIPAGVPLELKLVAKKSTYILDRQGKSAQQYQAWVSGMLNEKMPPPQVVDLVLELRNTGDKPLTDWSHGDGASRSFDLKGKGAVNAKSFAKAKRAGKSPTPVRLASGQTHAMPVTILKADSWDESGDIQTSWHSYWTEPGEYTLTASISTGISPPPKGAAPAKKDKEFGLVTLTSNAVKVKVVGTEKEVGKSDLAGVPLELKLLARKDTYSLVSGAAGPAQVDLELQVWNKGKQDEKIWVESFLDWKLEYALAGPGAVKASLPAQSFQRASLASPKYVLVQAGGKASFPLTSLESGDASKRVGWRWTKAGDYQLTVTFKTKLESRKDKEVSLTSKPVHLKLVAPQLAGMVKPKGLKVFAQKQQELEEPIAFASPVVKDVKDPAVSARIAKELGVAAIDWKTQMVVTINAGRMDSPGFAIQLLSLEVKEKTLTISWKLVSPRAGTEFLPRKPQLILRALVERFDGRVVLDPPGKHTKP